MALNIKNRDVENLLEQVVQITGESKTEAVRKALEERHRQLSLRAVVGQDVERLRLFLQDEIWPQIPAEFLGTKISKEQKEQILGYSEAGV